MKRYQVYWLIPAEEDLAELWAASRLKKLLSAAIHRLEMDLIERAHEVGRPFPLSQLDDDELNILLTRLQQLPEGLRIVEIEGIQIQFFIPPETAIAVVARLSSVTGFV